VSAKKITTTTPAHAAGIVDVQVVTNGGPNPASPAATFAFLPNDGLDPSGRTSLFVGQELGAVGGMSDYNQGYADYVGTPAGVTIYTGLRNPIDRGSGVLYLNNPRFDRSMLAIGLNLVDDLPNVVSGARDANITQLGNFIKQADRPVFLRIGYEFDGSWNHYDKAQYIQAFRRIMDRLHAQGVNNVVSVWQSSGYTTNPATLMQWYPGDDYVDWAAYSYFNQSNRSLGMLDIARERGKPVMIAEATPQRNLSLGDPNAHWNAWFQGFFQHIHANQDVIKAVAYINTRWFDQAAWDAGWGDSRVQIRPEIKAKWITEMQSGIWDPGDLDQAGNTYVLTPHDLTPP
jgi:glycosyl hydrolase family 26